MKCRMLFSGKNKIKTINLPSAELAQGVVMVKFVQQEDKYSKMTCQVWLRSD